MKQKHVEEKAEELLRIVSVVRNDVETAVALTAMMQPSSEEVVTGINSQPSGFVHCAALAQDAFVVAAFAAISRAHDCAKDAASLPNIFRRIVDERIRKAAGRGPTPDIDFAEAERLWDGLGKVAGFGGLEFALRKGTYGGNVSSVMKLVRNWQFAHNVPFKAATGPKLYHCDLVGIVNDSSRIVDALSRATGVCSASVSTASEVWTLRAHHFWRHQAAPVLDEA